MANTLFLRLEGPLQSWGERGRWSIRDTAGEPTKSAVVGLLGCALGLSDDAPLRELSEQLRMGVRVDRAGVRLVDYHTIGGGYDEPMLLTAQGKPKKSSGSPHTEISLRAYLCDASFLVALQGAEQTIESAASALQYPVWPFFLGRKACPPAQPVFEGTGDFSPADSQQALRAALEEWPWPFEWPSDKEQIRLRGVIESAPGQGVRRRDHLVSRTHRVFGPRYTRDIELTLRKPAKMEEAP